ncbi:MAG TPA: metallophosphoesterase [Thermoanaerobaculia bacterium]|nr:metallophosphoesterase [Thermoanaerobaculia bacterium]
MRKNVLALALLAAAALAARAEGLQAAAAKPDVSAAPAESPTIRQLRRASLEALAAKLPAKERAWAETLRTSSDSEKRAEAGNELVDRPDATDFVLALLVREKDPKVLRYTMMNIYAIPHFREEPRIREVLRYVVATSAEPAAVEVALEQLRALSMHALRTAMSDRIAREKTAGHDELAAALAPAEDRAINLDRGLMLPTFLRRSPPVFEKKVHGVPVRVLAFGDFGTGSDEQKATAAAMRRYHASHPFDFGLTLGDNFYGEGLPSPDHPRWKEQFEELYGPMDIEIFACFGNHDEYDPDSPAAEILRSSRSDSWRMPAQFYTYTAGPAQFFAIDCNDMSEVQQRWLRDALDASRARWKIVYGHFPPFLAADYENGEFKEFSRVIMPILRGRADVYFAGHHHSLQHVRDVDGVHLFISAGGGAGLYDVDEKSPRKVFAKSENGFAVMEIAEGSLDVRFVDKDSRLLYETAFSK